jgi:hypothetical protein
MPRFVKTVEGSDDETENENYNFLVFLWSLREVLAKKIYSLPLFSAYH